MPEVINVIVNDKVLFTLAFMAPDFGRLSGIFPYKIRTHPPEAYSERQKIFVVHYSIIFIKDTRYI